MTDEAIETQFGYHLIAKDDPNKGAEIEAKLKKDAARELAAKSKSLDVAKDVAKRIQADIKAGKSAEDAAKAAALSYARAGGAVPALAVRSESPNVETAKDAGTAADAGAKGGKKLLPKAPTADTDPDRPEARVSSTFNKGGDPLAELSADASSQVNKFAFSAKESEVMSEPVRTDTGYVVVALKEHKAATKEEFDKDRDTYVQTLLAAKQAEALALYVKRLRDASKADVRIDETYIKESTGAKDGGAPMDEGDDEGP
jgi:peptidyl-prolyl cis-trans isomerase D